ncbi:MAG: hypothetical protein ABI432_09255 [Flavobacteriales bacterium]
MKKSFLPKTDLMAVLVVAVMLLASCAKEPLIAPANVVGGEKDLTLNPSSGDASGENQTGSGKLTADPGTGISDDGDDLSDKERNKKKPN